MLDKRNLKALIITLILVMTVSVFSLADNSLILTAVNAAFRGIFQISASAASAGSDISDPEALKAENEELKKENARLREQLVDYLDTKEENERLRGYYELKEKNKSLKLLPAKVIRRDPNDDFCGFALDVGSVDSVKINDSVVTENGLVGRISRVDATTCMVTTILSPDARVAAVDKQSGDGGIISGSDSLCSRGMTGMGKLDGDNKIAADDIIVTSGTGGVYPPNLIVGKVRELEFNSYDASQTAVIEPYDDISSITAAAVVVDYMKGSEGE